MKRVATIVLLGTALATGACGGSSTAPQTPSPTPTPVQMAEVTFTYAAATAVDPGVDFDSCSPGSAVFTTHVHLIWINWDERRYMDPVGDDLFQYNAEVPVGQELRTALHDPNVCLQGDVYVAPSTLRANGVLLTRQVPVRDGIGLAFTVASDGSVTP